MEVRGKSRSVADVMSGALYFHGFLPRNEVEKLLQKDGDFLALEEERDETPLTVVAVKRAQTVLYFRIRLGVDGRMYSEADNGFDCLQSLLSFYHSGKKPLVAGSGAIPKRPVALRPWHILPSEILLGPVELGKGCFGSVRKAQLVLKGSTAPKDVAVKECQSTATKDRLAFFREGMIHHKASTGCPTVVELVGISSLTKPLQSVLEFLPLGDLAAYLKTEAGHQLGEWQLLKIGLDLALAMAHISKLGIIHLDLAARNALLKGQPPKGLRGMLADFGLAREASAYAIQPGDYISQRWAAPETLQANNPSATTKSDVWSFGVLLWELFAHASVPYPELADTQGLLVSLEDGQRMVLPRHFPQSTQLRKLVDSTWKISPQDRPSFAEITLTLSNVLKTIPQS